MRTTYIDFKILLLSVFILSFITGFSQSGYDFCNIQQSELDDYENKNGNCNTNPYGDFIFYDDLDTYIPNFDSEPLHNPPLKTIKLNINIFQKDDGTGNYPDNQETRDGLNQIIQWVNGIYNVCDPCDPIPGVQEIESTNIQFSIGEQGSERIYFYQNSQIWNSSSSTTLLNEVLAEDPERANCINVLISGSTGSYAYASMPVYTDLEKNQWVFLFYWGEEIILYAKANQLAHELGHNLAQLHTYLGGGASANCNNNDEYLSDVFGIYPGNCPHIGPPNIWGEDACEFPDDQKTNNLMGGNMSNCYISPKQAGQMHRTLAVTSARRFVEKVKSDIPLVIDNDETWDFDIRLYRDIIIEPGTQLTISCKVNMPYNGKIIVKQNAKLNLDNGTITTMDDEFWQGIEVWGNSEQHQYEYGSGNRYQGMVTLKNGAIIENAFNAITLWKPGDWHSMGGIVQATDAYFYNNRRSVEFMSYQNFHPILGDEYPLANISYFRDCHFEVNDDYINESDFHAHITMWDVNGISIRSSNFINQMTSGIHTGHGVYTASAGYSVLSKCNSQMSPCPEPYIVPCIFEGFYAGIEASNSLGTTYTIIVKEADFSNNTYGVKLSTVHNATIIKSDFEVGQNDQDDCEGEGEKSSGFGIFLDHCTGFAIEENEFTKFQGAEDNYTGIFVSNTNATDEIYKNNFGDLSYGNYAIGKNWNGTYPWNGLVYYCNGNHFNYADFYITVDQNDVGGIQSKQGDDEHVTGNKFSPNEATWHFYNGGNHMVGYYYCDFCPDENPDDDKIYNVTDKGKNFDNPCPSHYGGGVDPKDVVLTLGQKADTELVYATNLSDYNNVKALYDNLKDGGNTETTLNDVETAWPQDMWELRAELLGKSPHLSIDVLKAAADKTDVLPESVIFEIMAANPDELKKEELIKYLEDKENPLPEYMIDILRQVAEGTTYKTVLEQQMGRYNQAKTRAAHDIIRSTLNDSIIDYNDLRNWLDNIGGVRADEQIIASFIQEGNFADALTLADMMPGLYGYEGNQLTEHGYYTDLLNLQANLTNEVRSIFELTSDEIDNLVQIAETSYGTAAAQAKGILEFAYDYKYCSCIKSSGTSSYKSGSSYNYNALSKVYNIDIDVSPNPAKQWTAFNYTLPGIETEAVITISDISGKIIESFTVKGLQGQKIWDTRKIEKGVYFYTFTVNDISKSGKIVIN